MSRHFIAIISSAFIAMLQIGLLNAFGRPPIIILPLIVLLALLLSSRTKYIADFVLAAGLTQDIFSPLPFGILTGALILIGIIIHVLQLSLLSHKTVFSLFATAALATAAYIVILDGIELLWDSHRQLMTLHYFSTSMLVHTVLSACISSFCVVALVALFSFSPKYRLKPHILH